MELGYDTVRILHISWGFQLLAERTLAIAAVASGRSHAAVLRGTLCPALGRH